MPWTSLRKNCATTHDGFAGLQDESYIRLSHCEQGGSRQERSFLFYQHDPANTLYIVKSGELVVVLANADELERLRRTQCRRLFSGKSPVGVRDAYRRAQSQKK